MTLATDEFIRRFLIHVLPTGFHRIRHYGLFANGSRADHIAQARKLLAVPTPKRKADQAADATEPTALSHPCPCCGGRMIIIESSNAAQHRAIGQHHQLRSGSIRHDHDRDVANSQYPSFSLVDPPRRRSLNCALPIPAYTLYASIFIAQTRYLRSQPSAHVRQRRRSMRSIALAALAHLTDGAQIPIEPAARSRPTSRGFVPWRVSYAGPRSAWLPL
jgi:Putative transposase